MKSLLNSVVLGLALAGTAAHAACGDLPSADEIRRSLTAARSQDNGGFGLDMWGTVVDRTGTVCHVVFTGADAAAQWPGSRLISAAKAYTANAFSLRGGPLSTANLYSAVQPGGALFGLADGNPLNTDAAYAGKPKYFGTKHDPLIGYRVGGTITFGGGLPLYNAAGDLVGGLGVSGDSSCADHNVAWRTRFGLSLDYVPGSPIPGQSSDQIIYDLATGWGHPSCGAAATEIARALPAVRAAK